MTGDKRLWLGPRLFETVLLKRPRYVPIEQLANWKGTEPLKLIVKRAHSCGYHSQFWVLHPHYNSCLACTNLSIDSTRALREISCRREAQSRQRAKEAGARKDRLDETALARGEAWAARLEDNDLACEGVHHRLKEEWVRALRATVQYNHCLKRDCPPTDGGECEPRLFARLSQVESNALPTKLTCDSEAISPLQKDTLARTLSSYVRSMSTASTPSSTGTGRKLS